MFFLIRALICIAVIVAIADGLTPARLWSDSRQSVTQAATSVGGRFRDYCEHNLSRCMAILHASASEKAANKPSERKPGGTAALHPEQPSDPRIR
jgi:hypothetical protein